ncbi:hypothetical protein RvY_02408 [Ramazzottius varieornatus]|uniref:Condensin complex subunit 2 n=1 Tax=Ramazzottius varieornatus TaxID=947166 RepID=A0A1D1UJK7_RAMVA|nr:hypothetical protein RvY_02408 [Ramazzottius varieornatus]
MAASTTAAPFKVPKGPAPPSNKHLRNAPQTGSGTPSTSRGHRENPGTSARSMERNTGQGERNLESFESTIISTVRNGRQRRGKLEDLEDEELMEYSDEVFELNRKKQITVKNAFDCKIIDCTKELLKRSSLSQAISNGTAEETTQEMKQYASRLELGGRVYGLRVENTFRISKELEENLARAAQGKARKPRVEVVDDEDKDGGGGVGNASDEEATRLVLKTVKKKTPKGPRKSSVVKESELSCAETDTNANLISRYWTLIGNVQPGTMKDSWTHEGERAETAKSLRYVMDPDFTCLHRYNEMCRSPEADTSSAQRNLAEEAQEELSVTEEEVAEAEEALLSTVGQTLSKWAEQGTSVTDCVTFPKRLSKQLDRAIAVAASKQPRLMLDNMEAHTYLSEVQRIEVFRKACHQVDQEGKLLPGVVDSDQGDDAASEASVGDFRDDAGDMFYDTEGDVDLPEMPSAESSQAVESSQSSLRELSLSRTTAPSGSSRTTRAGSLVSCAENNFENNEDSPTPTNEESSKTPSIRGSSRARSRTPLLDATRVGSRASSLSRFGIQNTYAPVVEPDENAPLDITSALNDSSSRKRRSKSTSSQAASEVGSTLSKKKAKLDAQAWPVELDFGSEKKGFVYSLLEKKNMTATMKKPKPGHQDTLVDFAVYGRIMDTASMLDNVTRPADGSSVEQTLSEDVEALKNSLAKNKSWLKLEEGVVVDLMKALRTAFDENYDQDRLKSIWAKGDAQQDYNLSDNDDDDDMGVSTQSNEETFALGTPSAVPSSQADETPSVAASNAAEGTVERAAEVLHAVNGETGNHNHEEEDWRGTEIGGVEDDFNTAEPEVEAGEGTIPKAKEKVPTQASWSSSAEGEANEVLAFAENIALKDLTGSGVNIKEMRKGILRSYQTLRDWRRKACPASVKDEDLPLITVRHVVDVAPVNLNKKELDHVNPSVVLVCLLHLAYEGKLFLANSKDLNDLFVMNKVEFDRFSNDNAHLNRINEEYLRRLQRTQMVPKKAGQPLPVEDIEGVDLSVLSIGHSDDDEEGNPENGPSTSGHVYRRADRRKRAHYDSDDSD